MEMTATQSKLFHNIWYEKTMMWLPVNRKSVAICSAVLTALE